MSQHLHAMTPADHVLTVLPLFHVGGLNIQTTPALQLGASVSLLARFTAAATLAALARARPRPARSPSTPGLPATGGGRARPDCPGSAARCASLISSATRCRRGRPA